VVALWLGAQASSGPHYDWVDNLFAQVHGEKRVILCAPDEVPALYPFPDNHTKSQVAPLHPALRAFTRFVRAERYESTVGPGDVLFIPKGWWHFFSAPAESISLTCWFGALLTPRQELGALLRLRSPHVWAGVVRDFVWHGMLARPYRHRLFSLPPSGLTLYDLLRQSLAAFARR
jgi:lysine-specific demethylase 8